MTSLWLDTREALRGLRRSTGFAVISVISLALGIGATVAVFTLLNALLLRNLPVREPETLVDVSTVLPGRPGPLPLTFPAFRELDRRQQAFSSLIGWWGGAVLNVQVGNTLVRGNVWAVTGNFHSERGLPRRAAGCCCRATSTGAHWSPHAWPYLDSAFGSVSRAAIR